METTSMTNEPADDGRNAEVVTLHPGREHPAPGPAPDAPARPPLTVPLAEGSQRPVIPEHLATLDGIRATARLHLRRHWYKSRYHGLRSPAYLLRIGAYAVKGALLIVARVVAWQQWLDGRILESLAVAAGRAGHGDAMRAHTEGKKTRAARGKILAVAVVLLLSAAAAVTIYAPWWAWPLIGIVSVPLLARHGRPAGKAIIAPAVIESKYEKLTTDIVIRALSVLGISGIDKALREHREIAFVTPVTRDGPGYRVAIDLPHGVTPQEILDRRDKLASGLRRPLGCVWPEPEDMTHAGRLVLYVCDEPLSKARQPAYPLLRAGKADLFEPLPFGTDQRCRPVSLMLMFANLLIGSIPRQGKTVAMRVALLYAALDPRAELRIFELKGTGDLDPLAKCCHAYGSGADDDTIEAALKSLQQVAEVELVKRAAKIRALPKDECPDSKITPALAGKKSLGLHPLVFAIDEAQEAFSHPDFGKLFEQHATAVIKRGPALGIILVLATQRPDAKSLPTGVTSNVALRFCLRVMDQTANDMVLGTSAYKTGVRATLMTVNDKGCGYLVGAADVAQVTKTYNVNGPAAVRIADRARTMREQAGRLTGYALGETDAAEARSFAGDVLSVFGADARLWCVTIAARLAELVPGVYADITQEAVASQLRSLKVTVKDVRETGKPPRKGCEREAVAEAAGLVPGA
jgi:S-DNA-T family DNA segregation ATPase FtsK/SpoIIIE